MDHGWLYLLSWKRTMLIMNEDQVESYVGLDIVTPSVSFKDRYIVHSHVMLNVA